MDDEKKANLAMRGLALGVGMLFAYIAMQVAIAGIGSKLDGDVRAIWRVVAFAAASVGAVFLYRWASARLEKRDPVEMPPRPTIGLLWGFLLGVLLLTATQLIVVAGGAARIEGYAGLNYALPLLMFSVFTAVCEEIVFRGVIFRLLESFRGTWVAILGSGILFGGIHAMNPGATAIAVIAIAVEAGLMLGLAFALTRNLWFAIGIHAGWNFCEGGVFGGAVSGGASRGIFLVSTQGSELWTGGSFGLEASLPAVIVCVAASGVLVALVMRRRGDAKSVRR